MTDQQKTTIESALKRAQAEGIRIIGTGTMKADGARFFIVSAKGYEITGKAYIVKLVGASLVCNCRAHDICKHRAVCHQALKDERLAGLSAQAYAEQQAEAERLASQPRELANVETSEETKLEAIEQPVTYAGMVWSDVTNTWELPERVTDSYGAMIDRLSDTDAFWQDAPQAERAAKREAAVLVSSSDKPFSIYRS